MVCSHGVKFLDLITEGHSFVDNELQKIMRGCLSRQELELGIHGP